MRIAVVGAGIAGLAAAWELRGKAEVVVFDAGPLGGKLQTSDFCGKRIDEGPDAFITRTTEAVELCRELGMEHELVSPAAGRTLVWRRGKLRPLPDGLMLGLPTGLAQVVRSGLVTPPGVARAAFDLIKPRTKFVGDVSLGSLVRDRFGREVADELVGPLVGSIHAARIDDLSAELTAPQILSTARSSRSLLLAMRASRTSSRGADSPLFASPRSGMASLVDTLVDRLAGVGTVFQQAAVSDCRPVERGVSLLGSTKHLGTFDGVVLAVPASQSWRILGTGAPAGLSQIKTTSVAIATLAISDDDWQPIPGFNGFLVPAAEGRLMTACSFASNKWPHWKPTGASVVRISAGRNGNAGIDQITDTDLVGRLVEELSTAANSRISPAAMRVTRWPEALPLYQVGHAERVQLLENELAAGCPRVALAGSGYRGAGIPACIASGRRAARAAIASAS